MEELKAKAYDLIVKISKLNKEYQDKMAELNKDLEKIQAEISE